MTSPSEPMRLFYALWPDDATRAALMRVQMTHVQGRQARYENLHLTLVFLGDQPARLLPVFEKTLNCLPDLHVPLVLDRLGCFVRPGIAWAGTENAPDTLFALRAALLQSLEKHDVFVDLHTSFSPHVTLAHNADTPLAAPFDPIQWHAGEIALVQSITKATGVVYQVLASRRLSSAKN